MYTLISVYCSSFANMFANILGMKLLLVLFSVNAVSPQSCGIEGICHGFVGSWEISESLYNCVLSGRSLKNVSWVSYNLNNHICTSLEDCPSVDMKARTRSAMVSIQYGLGNMWFGYCLKAFLCTFVDQGVTDHFLFISEKHIVKQSKTSMLQYNIYQ